MHPKLNDRNRKAVSRVIEALADLYALDPLFADALLQELALVKRDPEGFIAACAPADRDVAREMIFGRRLKQ